MREMLCLEHAVLILCLFTCKASLINSWISVSPFVINITHSGNLHKPPLADVQHACRLHDNLKRGNLLLLKSHPHLSWFNLFANW